MGVPPFRSLRKGAFGRPGGLGRTLTPALSRRRERGSYSLSTACFVGAGAALGASFLGSSGGGRSSWAGGSLEAAGAGAGAFFAGSFAEALAISFAQSLVVAFGGSFAATPLAALPLSLAPSFDDAGGSLIAAAAAAASWSSFSFSLAAISFAF